MEAKEAYGKSLARPDESIRFPGIVQDLVEIAGLTVSRTVQDPGWRWSVHTRPLVGGDWCQARHVGVVVSGRLGFLLPDGTEFVLGPDDVYDVPPGHDGFVVGDEPAVCIEWAGMRTFAGQVGEFHDRVLATLLFTDVVGSTTKLVEVGDAAWRDLLAMHVASARAEIERFRGREANTTGDGLLASFDAPARALRCAAAIRSAAGKLGLQVRVGVHAGEVAFSGADVGGVAVHEAARVMAAASPGEILVSEPTRALVHGTGLLFEDRGLHDLKGLPEPRRLFAYVAGG